MYLCSFFDCMSQIFVIPRSQKENSWSISPFVLTEILVFSPKILFTVSIQEKFESVFGRLKLFHVRLSIWDDIKRDLSVCPPHINFSKCLFYLRHYLKRTKIIIKRLWIHLSLVSIPLCVKRGSFSPHFYQSVSNVYLPLLIFPSFWIFNIKRIVCVHLFFVHIHMVSHNYDSII